jgi:hypothetical protein
VRQVGHLQELYRDARSAEYKTPVKLPVNINIEVTKYFYAATVSNRQDCTIVLDSYYSKSRKTAIVEAFG